MCGYQGSRLRACTCTDGAIARYRARLSGPMLDRLDLRVDVPSVTFEELSAPQRGESSAVVRERVCAARATQLERQGSANAQIEPSRLRSSLVLTPGAKKILEHAVNRFGLSARAHDRTLRVGLTIKDLADVAAGLASTSWPVAIDEVHVGEALGYRQLDAGTLHAVTTHPGVPTARPT